MDDLRAEIKRLRPGRGIHATDLISRLGGELRSLAGIRDSASRAEALKTLLSVLEGWAQDLPDDMRLAFLAALGAHPRAPFPTLERRMEWAANELGGVSIRTVHRRVDDAVDRVVAELPATTPADRDGGYAPGGWYLASLRTTLCLDGEAPEALEDREVVSTVDGLEEVLVSGRIPREDASDADAHSLDLRILFGGSEVLRKRPTDSYFQHFIRLPRPLGYGERHTLSVAVRIPPGQPMHPRYIYYPLRRCDAFELRLRFDRRHEPGRVWQIPGLPRGVVDEYAASDALVRPDTAGEIRLDFHGLQPGFGYGARWR